MKPISCALETINDNEHKIVPKRPRQVLRAGKEVTTRHHGKPSASQPPALDKLVHLCAVF